MISRTCKQADTRPVEGNGQFQAGMPYIADVLCNLPLQLTSKAVEVCETCGEEKGKGHRLTAAHLSKSVSNFVTVTRRGWMCEKGHVAPISVGNL